jgi:hypothetical protein
MNLVISARSCEHDEMDQKNGRGGRWALLPLAGAMIWAGIANCSNESSNGHGGSGTCGELMSVYCEKMAACDPIGLRRDFGDVQGCVARQSLACPALSLPGTGWTAAHIQQCTAQISSAPSCYGDYAESGACDDAPGTLAGGAPCEQSSQCTSSRCERPFVRAPDGGLSDPACGVCSGADAGSFTGCGDGGDCSSGQRCVYVDNQTSRCVSLQAEGAPCTATSPCAADLFCRRSAADAGIAGVCAKRGSTSATCTASNECDTAAGLRCVTAVCNAPIFVAVGEACDGAGRLCEKGARCIYSNPQPPLMMGTCRAPVDDGSRCDSAASLHCRSPASCREGICRLPGDGQCQ